MPIWKQEHWAGGSDWAVEQHPIRPSSRSGVGRRRGLPLVRHGCQRDRHRDRARAQPATVVDGAQHRRVRTRAACAGARSTGRRRGRPPTSKRRVPCLATSRSISVRPTLSCTRAGRGIILNEPTVIALNSRTQDVLAMGQEAWQMIGRTPGYIVAVRPLRGGAITDFEITQRMIRLLVPARGSQPVVSRARADLRAVGDHARRAAGGARSGAPCRRRADLPHRTADGRRDRRRPPDPRADGQHGRRHRRRHHRGRRDLARRRRRRSKPSGSARSTSTPRSRPTCAASTASRSVSAPPRRSSSQSAPPIAVDDELQGRSAGPRPHVGLAEDDLARPRRGPGRDRGAGRVRSATR